LVFVAAMADDIAHGLAVLSCVRCFRYSRGPPPAAVWTRQAQAQQKEINLLNRLVNQLTNRPTVHR
jgi:hypothetical protein